jgi:hypothetical protein
MYFIVNMPKIKSNDIYNMGRLSKIQKARKSALTQLDLIKDKLNIRTYNAFRREVNEKRIDAVKRLEEKFSKLKGSVETNITKKKVSSAITKVDKNIKASKIQTAFQKALVRKARNNSIVVENPRSGNVWEELKQLKGTNNSARITILDNGNIIKTFVVDLNAKNKDVYYNLFYDVEYNDIFEEYPNAELIITKDENITPQRISQAFKQGTTNCLFLPIINWCQEKADSAGTDATRKKYISKRNVAKKLEEQYRESGVVKDELKKIADKLQINFIIRLPFQDIDPIIEVKCDKKQLTTFEYINTKLNHVDGFTHNQIVNKKIVQLSCEELEKMYNELHKNGDYFLFKRGHNTISQISTLEKTYIQKQDFLEFTKEFCKMTGLNGCHLCDFRQSNLSQYVRASCNANMTIDFKPMEDEDDYPIEYEGYNHMDMEKAYKNVDKCKFYQGYLGKITDFRKTDKIVKIGIYTITNLVLPEKLDSLNKKMLIWKNDNPYPSPELEWLKEQGATFDITEGCWGSSIDFNFDLPEWLNIVDDNREKTKTRWYAKFVGCMEYYSDNESYYMNAEPDYIKNLISYLPEDKYRVYEDEVRFVMSKTDNRHLTHIASFIKCYTRINMMEQLLTMNQDDILRVCVDGIYYFNEYEHQNIFRDEPKEIKQNIQTGSYTSNYFHNYEWKCEGEFKEFYSTELHTGVGGGGKTHKALVDGGNVKIKYFAPSWKLARKKAQDYNVRVDVWYNLLTKDPEIWGKIHRNYNVLVIDEVSMMSNESKELLFERYSDLKIIMCGDIGYQLGKIGGEGTDFKKEGFDYYEEHNTNYRVECKRLLFLLNKIREMMRSMYSSKQIKDYILLNFQIIEGIKDYDVNDMILTHTNKRKDEFTEMFKHLEKYYVKENTQLYSNGEILLHKPINTISELRHAYTTHSIQGETCEGKLFIDIDHLNYKKLLYTALSRARRWEQIYLVK